MLASIETDQPEVRLASPGDEEAIVAMLRDMHAATDWPIRGLDGHRLAFNTEKVRATVQAAIVRNRNAPDANQSWIGVVGTPGQLMGSASVCVQELWCEDGHVLTERWNWIYPQYRKGHIARALISFSLAMADKLGLSLLTPVVISTEQMARSRLYARRMGSPIGNVFLYSKHSAGTA